MSPKPILKWVGGKTQIIEQLFSRFPKNMEKYHEPFLGGGSVLFTLLQKVQEGEITVNGVYVSDLNEALIGVYKNIQNNYLDLFRELGTLIQIFQKQKHPKKVIIITFENYTTIQKTFKV